ncbi:MAG: exosortase H [candidate division Zixibacteria bacterium]|nr:exosortase H [candidate division Zixibacteria bacterium]
MKKEKKIDRAVLRSLLRLYLIFGAVMGLFVVAFFLLPVRQHVISPFTSFIAVCSSFLMNVFGAGSYVSGTMLATSQYSIDIVDGCNGIYATAILISGVIAYPSTLKDKIWGILLGTAAIFALNLGRVISLFYMGQHYPDIFNEVHVYVWQPIIILWAIFIWDFWSRRIKKETALGPGAVSA